MKVDVVVGHPYSDIGKGWLAASIGIQRRGPVMVKIDPLLEEADLDRGNAWVPRRGRFVLEDDGETYAKRGLPFGPGQQISIGPFMNSAIQRAPFPQGQLTKEPYTLLTMPDVSAYLAADIDKLMSKNGTNGAIIEVGGATDDTESGPVPGAIRWLSQKHDTGIVLLTKFDHTVVDGVPNLKTRVATRAIETTMSKYWGVPLRTVFVRRDHVPDHLSDEELREGTEKIAFKTQQDPANIVFLPNVERMEEIDPYTTIFADNNHQLSE